MARRRDSFRTIRPDFLLKLGCPPHLFASSIWKAVAPSPVDQWGEPVGTDGDALIIAVRSRECLDAFRSQEKTILGRLAAHGLRMKSLRIRLKK